MQAERLLAHHVLAGLERREHRICVGARGRADDDQADIRIAEHLGLVGVHANRPFARRRLAPLG